MSSITDYASKSNSWPFVEARKIIARINNRTPDKGYVLFETGYGPSGLPHLGTFGEAARTTFVRNAFELLTEGQIPIKFFAFSDDMDGLRKIPDNIPNKELIREHLGKPLTHIPDPFGTHESFGHHMNNRLINFLDEFGFNYEFKSASECYKSGMFDEIILRVLRYYNEIMEVMLPSLRAERQATYSPILPICPKTGVVLQVPIIERNLDKGTITYEIPGGEIVETPVTGGHSKLQWKVDWAMRWCVLEVDYEMHGKDLIPTAELSTKIARILGYMEPILYKYELFLDEKGQKISKSKGNGLSMEEWLRYAPKESLALYMYQSPGKAKRLYFDVIPKAMDEYLIYLNKFHNSSDEQKLDNPIWHIHAGNPPVDDSYGLNFSLLLNLASVCNPDNKEVLWGFIEKYIPAVDKENNVLLNQMSEFAVRYYNDFIKPNKKFKEITDNDRNMLNTLKSFLSNLTQDAKGEDIQNGLYDICRENGYDTKEFFINLYHILLGQDKGPRWGSFIALYGIENIISKIDAALAGKLV